MNNDKIAIQTPLNIKRFMSCNPHHLQRKFGIDFYECPVYGELGLYAIDHKNNLIKDMTGFCIDDIWGFESDYRVIPNKDKTDLICAFEIKSPLSILYKGACTESLLKSLG